MLGRIRVKPRWEDDPVHRKVEGWGDRAGVGCLPQTDIRRQEERVVRVQ